MRLVVAPGREARDRHAPRLTGAGRGWLMVATAAAVAPGVLLVEARGLSTGAGLIVACALVAAQTVAMWWMDSRPVAVTVVAVGLGAGAQALAFPGSGPGAALIAVCCLAWLRPARVSLWGLGGFVALSGLLRWGRWDAVAAWAAAAALAWSVGALGRARAARRRAEASRAAAEERARIAGEIHDILSHGISVMMVNASVAEDAFSSDLDRVRSSIREVAEQGRWALREVRGVLRALDGHDAAGAASGLSELDRLVGSMRAAGLVVGLRVSGVDAARLPREVDLAAYRVIQESLTNALRHGDSGRAVVSISTEDGSLRLRVQDGAPARPAPEPADHAQDTDAAPAAEPLAANGNGAGRWGAGVMGDRDSAVDEGRGIAGMRRRVERLGGTLSAGRGPAGGFAVDATIPLEGNG